MSWKNLAEDSDDEVAANDYESEDSGDEYEVGK